jgi:hypothetical protein
MPPAEIEPAIAASERPQTLDRAATEIDARMDTYNLNMNLTVRFQNTGINCSLIFCAWHKYICTFTPQKYFKHYQGEN